MTARKPRRPEMVLIVRATYQLGHDGTLTAVDDPAELDHPSGELVAQGEHGQACVRASDFAEFKLQADVLVRATCHAPKGRAVPICPARVKVGAWSKLIRVVGDRTWTKGAGGARPSEPVPFVSMPITWDRAFGGKGFAKNPVGCGVEGDVLPNLEAPGAPLYDRSDRPEPMTFLPIFHEWPSRAGKLGRNYGRDYQKSRAPFWSDDFDWSYFSAAPADQRIDGYLRGDEAVVFENLHPATSKLETRLPGLRVRAFVLDDRDDVRELDVRLDTLDVNLDEERLHLVWRGLGPVREDDLDDIAFVLIATEELSTSRRSAASYEARLRAFAADPQGIEAAKATEEAKLLAALTELGAGGDSPGGPAPDDSNPVSELLGAKLGKLKQDEQKRIAGAIATARESLPEEQQRDFDEKLTAIAKAAKADAPPPMRTVKPGSRIVTGLRRTMRKVLDGTKQARAALDDPPDAQRPGLTAEQREKLIAQIDEAEKAPFDPKLNDVDEDYAPPVEPLSSDEPGPGKDLSERDWTGFDFRKMDLSNADFTEAILTRAQFDEAKLEGASFRKAMLFRTSFERADLRRADLTKANAAQAVFRHANLREAKLDQTYVEDGVLDDADLRGAVGEYFLANKASAARVRADDAHLPRADFSEAILDGASFKHAELAAARFEDASGRELDLEGAQLENARFSGGTFVGARFVQAKAAKSVWIKACLDRADLTLVQLTEANLEKVRAHQAILYGADLRRSKQIRIDLEGANLERSNLFRAELAKANLSRVRFVHANLYEAVLRGARGDDADFENAVLTNVVLSE